MQFTSLQASCKTLYTCSTSLTKDSSWEADSETGWMLKPLKQKQYCDPTDIRGCEPVSLELVDDVSRMLRPLLGHLGAGGHWSRHPLYGHAGLTQHPHREGCPRPRPASRSPSSRRLSSWCRSPRPRRGWSDLPDSWSSGLERCSTAWPQHRQSCCRGGGVSGWGHRWSCHPGLTCLRRQTGSSLRLPGDPELGPDPVQRPGVAAEAGPGAVLGQLDVARA